MSKIFDQSIKGADRSRSLPMSERFTAAKQEAEWENSGRNTAKSSKKEDRGQEHGGQ